MATITVYHYELTDPTSGTVIRSRVPATRRAIDAAGGRVLAESAVEVDLEMVNEDGIVVRGPLARSKKLLS